MHCVWRVVQAIVVHISDLGAFFVFAPLFVQHHFPLTLEDEVEQPSRISHGRPRARRGKAEGQAPRTRALSASFARCRSHESALSSDALCPRAGASGGSGGSARCRDRSAHQAGRAPLSPLTRRTIRERAVAGGREAVEAEGGGRRGAPPPRGSRPAGAARRYVYPCVTPGRRSRTASAERAMASGLRRTWAAASRRPAAGVR